MIGEELITLGNFVEQIRGISYKPDEIVNEPAKDFVPVLRATNFDETGLKLTDLNYIHKSRINAEQFIQAGDILVASSSGSKDIVGKSIQFREPLNASFGAFCKLIRVKSGLDNRFVAHFFKTPYYRRFIRASIQGANINNLKNEHINNLKVPKLSLNDQTRIADVLTKAESLITQRKESIRLLDELLKSRFLEMFGAPGGNEKGWNLMSLGEVVVNEDNLRVPLKKQDRQLRRGQYPYYGASGIIDTIDDFTHEGERLLIGEDGANLLLRSSPIAFRALGKFWVNNHAHVLASDGRTNLRFIEYYINAIDLKSYVTGSAQPKLNRANLDSIRIFYPPPTLQDKFAQIVDKVEALKSSFRASLQELENLYGALSQKAFRRKVND